MSSMSSLRIMKNCGLGREDMGYSYWTRFHHCEHMAADANVRTYGGEEG